jgi:hypothetical protein
VPASGGDFCLRVLNGAGTSPERNAETPEGLLELETGNLQEFGGFSE